MTVKPKPRTARQKLERSQLQKITPGGFGDIDVNKFRAYLQGKLKYEISDRMLDATLNLTVEGASTLEVILDDYDRSVLRSGTLSSKLDVEVDGLWFRLAQVKKSEDGDSITLVFEEREVKVLKTYAKKIWAARKTTTRAEFVLRILREVREFTIVAYIPELHVVQPITAAKDLALPWEAELEKEPGIPYDTPSRPEEGTRGADGTADPYGTTSTTTGRPEEGTRGSSASARAYAAQRALTVKGKRADRSQISNANTILRVGTSMGVRRKVLVAAIMTAITESRIINNPGGDAASAGIFQQQPWWGSYKDRTDPATSSRLFFTPAIKADNSDPTRPYWDLCAVVQNPREDLRDAYQEWHTEAERFVTAFGIPGGDTEGSAATANNSVVPEEGYSDGGNSYMYYRWDPNGKGVNGGPEDSWECIQRLAQEVNWRAFFVDGRFYFLSEDELFKARPVATIREFQNGVGKIGGDYDSGKKSATATFSALVDRWSVPPGSVVVLRDMGPWNGRWLVTEVNRSLFDSNSQITLKKPAPKLPEPLENDFDDGTGWGSPRATTVEQTAAPVGDYGTTAEIAKAILQHKEQGNYRDDNGRQLSQLQKMANGQKLNSQCGTSVYMDSRVLGGILHLLDQGYWVGTFAFCEDHKCNLGQHPKGQAVDISSLGKPGLGWFALNTVNETATKLALEVMNILGPTAWDLICNGVGETDSRVQALQVDNGIRRDGAWASGHRDHIHWGIGIEASGGS